MEAEDLTNSQDTTTNQDLNGNKDNLETNALDSNQKSTNNSSDIYSKYIAENTELKEKYLRLMAEFENFKKRTSRERLELITTAGKDIIVSFLDVVDDCDRAEKILDTETDLEKQKAGIRLIFNKFRIILQNKGVIAMESLGTNFDTEKHEAITEIEVNDETQKGKIVDVISKGYLMNTKIIRFAKVIVGK